MTLKIFIILLALAASSWFLGVFETIFSHSFLRFAFRIGIPVKRISLEINTNKLEFENNETIRMSVGKFHFLHYNVYFLSQMFFFRIGTPFPIKAIATISPNNKIDIVARIPLGTSLFFLFWSVILIGGCISAGMQLDISYAIGFGLIGCFIAALMIGISYPIEKNRFDKMTSELKQIITARNKTDFI